LTPGVLYLLASVGCSVTVAVLLKLARRYDIDVRQAIAVNYAVAALLCWAVLRPDTATLMTPRTPWAVLAALGVLLPSVFLAMAAAVRHAGIVRSDAAQRLSLFIPLLAAFLLFGEPVSGRKLAAILLAFSALACLLRRARPGYSASGGAASGGAAAGPAAPHGRSLWVWPLAVWAGYGVIDILFKQVARAGTAFAGGLLLAFVLAGLLMLAYLLARRVRWERRHLLAGVALGLANFGNILTYIRAHQSLPEHPALVFASMNMGVITLGTLVGALAFREPLTRVNAVGIVLALAAIVVMAPW
jgi:drug/metabolite transporter (DMT)-like permease